MGFKDSPTQDAVEAFAEAVASCRSGVRAIHERLYFRPLLEAFAGAPGGMSVEAAEERLAAFGFKEARRTREAVRELTRGLTRSSRLMQQLLPLLLEWLSLTPDPDLGLLSLRTLTTGPARTSTLIQTFRDSPESARRLCVLVGTSRLVGTLLHHNPDLAASLGDDARLAPRARERLVERAATALSWRDDSTPRQQEGLKRFTDREGLRVMAADVLGMIDTPTVGVALTRLAESALEAALATIDSPMPFAVVALGRFGGQELSYASDLDVIFVHDSDDAEEAARVAGQLLGFLGGPSPVKRVYAIDADLRPEGRNGVLSRPVDGYVTYHERWAEPWERQALVRARPVAGDVDLGDRLIESLRPFVWDAPLTTSGSCVGSRLESRRNGSHPERTPSST
jgi:glutamate-ammonia-ligase adenylyltransferase